MSIDPASAASAASARDAATAAFRRLADALNRPRDPAWLRAAVIDDVRIDRHAPGEPGTAPVAESFAGVAEALRWFARTPPAVRFSLAGAARPGPEGGGDGWADGWANGWVIEYAIDAGDFHHGGIWLARLAGDGRIAFLAHHPFALGDGSSGPAHAHEGSAHTRGG